MHCAIVFRSISHVSICVTPLSTWSYSFRDAALLGSEEVLVFHIALASVLPPKLHLVRSPVSTQLESLRFFFMLSRAGALGMRAGR